MKKGPMIAFLCAMLTIAGCAGGSFSASNASESPGTPGAPGAATAKYSASDVDARIVQASNRFGLRLYEQLAESEGEEENLFISPASISTALSMTYNGASGDTKTAMETALQLQGLSLSEINEGYRVLLDVLRHADPDAELTIANSLWAKEGRPFHDAFLDNNRTFYGAETNFIDLQSPDALKSINGWVKKHTDGKIEEIVKKIDPDAILLLLNAIYFKGEWSVPFEERETKEGVFRNADGSKADVPMMSRDGDFEYKRAADYEAVRLPYGKNGLRMVLYVPSESSDVSVMTANMLADPRELTDGFTRTPGSLRMPRFKLEYEIELKDALSALGMANAFDGSLANFDRMVPAPKNVHISRVLHKTFLEVNEEGAEAAAVTAVEVVEESASVPANFFTLDVNRPFFFTIEESSTGTFLFLGSVKGL